MKNNHQLQPLSLGQIMFKSISLYIKTLPSTMILVIFLCFPTALFINFYPDLFSISTDEKGQILVGGINSLLSFVLLPLIYSAIAPITAGELSGIKSGPITGLRFLLRSCIPLLITGILGYLIIIFGLVLLVIPGIIFLLWFLLLPQIVAFEGISLGKGLARGRELVKGYLIKELLIVCGVSAIFFIVSMGIMVMIVDLPSMTDEKLVIIYSVIQALLYPILANALTLLYIDLRVRKEDFDIDSLKKLIKQDHSAGGKFGTVGNM